MKKTFSTLLCYSIPSFFLFVSVAHAEVVFAPMTGFFENVQALDATQFIQTLYGMAITIAALLAVIKIIYAGVQYMLTDVITTKGSAKKEIYGAILGLLIVLTAVYILDIINPDLNNFALFTGIAPDEGLGAIIPAELPDVSTTP